MSKDFGLPPKRGLCAMVATGMPGSWMSMVYGWLPSDLARASMREVASLPISVHAFASFSATSPGTGSGAAAAAIGLP